MKQEVCGAESGGAGGRGEPAQRVKRPLSAHNEAQGDETEAKCKTAQA